MLAASSTTPAAAPAAPKQVTLRFSGWIAMEDSGKPAFKLMKDRFESQNPGVAIEYIGIPAEQSTNQAMVMAAGGNAPDCAQLGNTGAITLAASGALEPLESLLDPKILADIPDSVRGVSTYDNKLLSVVWWPTPFVLYYNKTVLQKAGLDPNKPPKTWDEVIEQSAKVGAYTGEKLFGWSHDQGKLRYGAQWSQGVIWGFGADFVADNKAVLNTPQSVAAWTRMKKWFDMPGNTWAKGIGVRDVRDLFSKDKLAFTTDGPYLLGIGRNISGLGDKFDSHWGATLMPPSPKGKSEGLLMSHSLAIFKQSKIKDVAARWVNFLLSDREVIDFYNKEMGFLPPTKSNWTGPAYETDFMKTVIKQMDGARPLPKHPKADPTILTMIAAAQQEILLNNKDVKEVLDNLQKNVELIMT
jgi:multiple sugar transport system substrate-binding protein